MLTHRADGEHDRDGVTAAASTVATIWTVPIAGLLRVAAAVPTDVTRTSTQMRRGARADELACTSVGLDECTSAAAVDRCTCGALRLTA